MAMNIETDLDSNTESTDDAPSTPNNNNNNRIRSRHSMDESHDATSQLQSSPTTRENSASPRPPPLIPPPPVPAMKPPQQEIDTASNHILSNLDDLPPLFMDGAQKSSTFSRGRNRRRRASLPSINILPSFKHLKHAMGFGDDAATTTPVEEKPVVDVELSTTSNSGPISGDAHSRSSGNGANAEVTSKKNHPSELKQLYIKNIRLQARVAELEESGKNDQIRLHEGKDQISELHNQISLKNSVLKTLQENVDVLSKELEDTRHLKRLIVEKDTNIQALQRLLSEKDENMSSLKRQMSKLESELTKTQNRQLAVNVAAYAPNSSSPRQSRDGANSHSRSMTPGGYEVNPVQWHVHNEHEHENVVRDPTTPSAPSMADQFMDDAAHGMSLTDKLSQRPPWKELNERGILLSDPTSKMSASLQAESRTLHKRKASLTVDKMLRTRPNPQQLHRQHVIPDSATAALFFGASPTSATNQNDNSVTSLPYISDHATLTPTNPNLVDFTHIVQDNINQSEITRKLDAKLRQRPSMQETLARGILLARTDTKINYDLQARHRQLHKRKASQNLEKLFVLRSAADREKEREREQGGGGGVFVPTQFVDAQSQQHVVAQRQQHKRKTSMDLEAGLKKRKSLSQMQGLGLLFTDQGIEFGHASDEEADSDAEDRQDEEQAQNMMMSDAEHAQNTAGIVDLFRQKPRTSKPLQEADFKGLEFVENRFDIQQTAHKKRNSLELELEPDEKQSKNRPGTQHGEQFEPFKLTKRERISRIGDKLRQRPSVDDMRMRGLLFEHPSMSKSLVERKRALLQRRASNKIDTLLQSRPNRSELENKNILLKPDESLEIRKRHKRKRSLNLENAIQRRPKLMEEQEAQQQRRRSMTESDFKPDYLAHIFAENDDDGEDDFAAMDIRFLNIGGYVIPLVSPKFMSDLVAGPSPNAAVAAAAEKDRRMLETENLANANAEKERRRVQLQELQERVENMERQLADADRVRSEFESTQHYLEHLRFYMKEHANVELPSPQKLDELKSAMRRQLDSSLHQRPSALVLQQKSILSSNFMSDVTNQNVQIADKQRQFRRSSQVLQQWLTSRPSKQSLQEQFANLFVAGMNGEDGDGDGVTMSEIEDNATKQELRQELIRLNSMLRDKVHENNRLVKDNEAMRAKTRESLNENATILGRGLTAHSMAETEFLHQAFVDLSQENDENKISELERVNHEKTEQIQVLQQKIRRLSSVHVLDEISEQPEPEMQPEMPPEHAEHAATDVMKQFVVWAQHEIEWPQPVQRLFDECSAENEEDEQLRLRMQTVIATNQQIWRKNASERERLRQAESERQKHEHLMDKQRFAMETMRELNRMRESIKNVGMAQQTQTHTTATSAGYWSTAASFLW